MGSEPFFFLIHVHCCNGTPAMWHQWHVDEDANNMYLFREHMRDSNGSFIEMKRAKLGGASDCSDARHEPHADRE